MSGGVQVGVGLALLAALMTNLSSLFKHRGAQSCEPVSLRHPLRTAKAFARSPWFAAGFGVAAIAWGIHVAALAMAPISLVQAVLAAGAVTLAVMAQKIFGHPIARRQWIGLALGSTGLALLVLTVPQLDQSHSSFSPGAMIAFEGGLIALAGGLALSHRAGRLSHHGGVLLAASAGVLFALAGIAIKGLTGGGETLPLFVTLLCLILLAGFLAQFATAASLQRGEAVAVIGLTGLIANAAQIAGGVLVFGDPLSPDPAGVVLQALAFCAVCGSVLLLPAAIEGGGANRPVAA